MVYGCGYAPLAFCRPERLSANWAQSCVGAPCLPACARGAHCPGCWPHVRPPQGLLGRAAPHPGRRVRCACARGCAGPRHQGRHAAGHLPLAVRAVRIFVRPCAAPHTIPAVPALALAVLGGPAVGIAPPHPLSPGRPLAADAGRVGGQPPQACGAF